MAIPNPKYDYKTLVRIRTSTSSTAVQITKQRFKADLYE